MRGATTATVEWVACIPPADLPRALAQLRGRHPRSRLSRALLRRAFDLGVTHFDLANNYGPPVLLGRGELRATPRRGPPAGPRRAHRSRRRPATTCGPGPYGEFGSRKHLRASPDRPPCDPGSTTSTSSTRHRSDAGDPPRRDDGRPRHPGAAGQGRTSGSPLTPPADARGGGAPPRPRHAAPDPSARRLAPEPLGRARSAARPG